MTKSCETCKFRRLIDGEYRCYGVLPEKYGCKHWRAEQAEQSSTSTDGEKRTCESCQYRTLIEGEFRCYGVLPEEHSCENWEEKEAGRNDNGMDQR